MGRNVIDFQFRATEAQRSMESFMEGLFGSRNAVTPEESSLNDTLLNVSDSTKCFFIVEIFTSMKRYYVRNYILEIQDKK